MTKTHQNEQNFAKEGINYAEILIEFNRNMT